MSNPNAPSAPPIYYLNQQSWPQQAAVQAYYNQQPQPAHTPPQRENTCLPVLQMFLCLCCLEECLFFNF